jgi:hypothetical protein
MNDLGLPPPAPNLRASIVVPAKDEEDLIGRCVRSLGSQTGMKPEEYEVILVLDRCNDATADRATEAASDHPELRLTLLEGPGLGAGYARRMGMEAACERLLSLGRPGALIASTDADTVVAPDWLYRQLQAAEGGARAIGGRIELLDEDGPSEEIRSWRDRRGKARHLALLEQQDSPNSGHRVEHWQFSGASMSLTAEAYREVGGMEPRAALEDEQLESALDRCNIPIQRPLDVRVSTSPRLVGRANRGLAKDLSLASWLKSNTYPKPPNPPATGLHTTVSIIVPVDGVDASGAPEIPGPPELAGVWMEVVPVTFQDAPLTEGYGTVQGRGDALWRGLSEAQGEIVVLLPDLSPSSLTAVPALLLPLLERESLEMVKGYPPEAGGSELSRLVGRPLINLHYPELAGFNDPLSGFVAARRPLLGSLTFPCGAGVDISLLLDTARSHGVNAVAQAALPPQPTRASVSSEESYAIIAAILSRTPGGIQTPPSPAPLVVPEPAGEGFDVLRVHIEERAAFDGKNDFGGSKTGHPFDTVDSLR